MDCNIVLLPDDELAQKAYAVSRRLAEKGGFFTLEDGKYFPHVSLYTVRLKPEDLPAVGEILRQLASTAASELWKAAQYDFSRGYVIADYQKTEQAVRLQEQVLEAINPLRDGMLPKAQDKVKEATGVALQNYETYGYKYVGEFFHPHITLTRFSEDRTDVSGLLPSLSEFDGSFSKLGLFELGEHSTCVRRIADFDLQSMVGAKLP